METSPFQKLIENERKIMLRKALSRTKGNTPVMKFKNSLISLIEQYKEEFDLLTEERKEINKHAQVSVTKILENICLALEEYYINDEKEFVKNIFKDGKDERNEKLKPHFYYEHLINQ
jgi:hypothetical protein